MIDITIGIPLVLPLNMVLDKAIQR